MNSKSSQFLFFKQFILIIFVLLIYSFISEPLYAEDSLFIPDIETYMQIGAISYPQISGDGKIVYFTTWLTGVTQLYRVDTDGGWPFQLTFFEDGIDFYSLSPDFNLAVVGLSKGGSEQAQLYLVETSTGKITQLTDVEGAKFGSPVWSPDGSRIAFRSNEVNGRDFYIYVMDIKTKNKELKFDKEGYNYVADWSADGRCILVNHLISNTNRELYLLDMKDKKSTLLTPHKGDVLFYDTYFTTDTNSIYMLTNYEHERIKLARLDVNTKKISFVIEKEGNWDIEELFLAPTGEYLAWIVNEEGYGRLKLYDLETQKFLATPSIDGIVTSPTFSNDGIVCFAFSNPSKTQDAWIWDWHNKKLIKVTHSTYAGVDPSSFIDPELIRYNSFDGLEISAFLYLPSGYEGGKLPFVIHAHGGPESQFRPGFIRHFQYLLRNGYGILSPNIRGSSGYGKEYIKLDDYKKRTDSVKDIEYATRWLIEKGLTDSTMLAIKGASYGGYMTLAALTSYPHLFAAGIDVVGIANFVTFLENTKPYRRVLREAEYGPLTDMEFLTEISPLTHAENIKAPLLIIHGENDPRVPVSEARQIAKAIESNGGIVETLIFPDEGHGVGKLSNRLIMYRRMVDFLDKYVKK
ncbi:MAG: S9 family peptidase [Candidatus Stahlbacteria bacterium]|nr:MAG: S9 family peptidase [Candidatus Stahlbacteria bacterium]